MEVVVGGKYRHFKGAICEVLLLATHSETLEEMVVYKHNGKVWVRPYNLFVSLVDKKKYPNIKQKYRFELVDDINDWKNRRYSS